LTLSRAGWGVKHTGLLFPVVPLFSALATERRGGCDGGGERVPWREGLLFPLRVTVTGDT